MTTLLDQRAVPLALRSRVVLAIASLAGLLMLCWPLLVQVPADGGGRTDPPFLFLLLLPLVIAVVIAPVTPIVISRRKYIMLPVVHVPVMHRPSTPQWWSNSSTQRWQVRQWWPCT